MERAFSSLLFLAAMLLLLAGCGTSRSPLPTYEPPLARANLQNVRTTAYTHTEADHLEYGNHNALGGTLHAAAPPVTSAAPAMVMATTVLPTINADGLDDGAGGFRGTAAPSLAPRRQTWQEALDASNTHRSTPPAPVARVSNPLSAQTPLLAAAPVENHSASTVYGSAAADWSRWPAGTIFRIVSTGQLYRVDDYGWALSGRNTIDLYMPTRSTMNAWGVRKEPIQILQWGDREESLRRLRNHQDYRHIKRMVLELEGHDRAAARLE